MSRQTGKSTAQVERLLGIIPGYFSQSINQSNHKIFNIFDLSDYDRNQMKIFNRKCLFYLNFDWKL